MSRSDKKLMDEIAKTKIKSLNCKLVTVENNTEKIKVWECEKNEFKRN